MITTCRLLLTFRCIGIPVSALCQGNAGTYIAIFFENMILSRTIVRLRRLWDSIDQFFMVPMALVQRVGF